MSNPTTSLEPQQASELIADLTASAMSGSGTVGVDDIQPEPKREQLASSSQAPDETGFSSSGAWLGEATEQPMEQCANPICKDTRDMVEKHRMEIIRLQETLNVFFAEADPNSALIHYCVKKLEEKDWEIAFMREEIRALSSQNELLKIRVQDLPRFDFIQRAFYEEHLPMKESDEIRKLEERLLRRNNENGLLRIQLKQAQQDRRASDLRARQLEVERTDWEAQFRALLQAQLDQTNG